MGILQDDVIGDIGAVPVCKDCGSERVARDAWACWNAETGLWELETVFDECHCHVCEETTTLVWKRVESVPRKRIRELNDLYRTEGRGNGLVVITHGVQEKGEDFVNRVCDAVRAFDGFSDKNDPWGEHDFGSVEIEGEKIFWKIDYYDPTLTAGSENPANEALTKRVLTLLLPSEY
ncbi:hypothetical protein DDZ14_02735 [Maritimibacter sp. 55A14]|uniref:DUF3768 domain-containing protein n=1 Tax=Maritimibacter sp. 55A14 TaxID=2174844 RepID=UPI000D606CC3|nr:DUF3768 domain-containing protein [Maritimibacter sp. 55A14]PWE34091.1 hypothetical protein DDZ14_02735 [Maritimibacter sp. 55A14]